MPQGFGEFYNRPEKNEAEIAKVLKQKRILGWIAAIAISLAVLVIVFFGFIPIVLIPVIVGGIALTGSVIHE